MAKLINFYYLISIVIILTNTIYAKTIEIKEYDEVEFIYKDKKWGKPKNETNTLTKGDDGYYMVFVNTTDQMSSHQKRDEKDNVLNFVINKIQELILDNKDTYEDISKLEAIENDTEEDLEKRETKYLVDYGDSNLVYPISSVNGRTVLYAYLSEELAGIIEKIPEVTSCMPNYPFEYDTYYKLNEIKQEAQWDDVDIRYNTDLHLSLLSQGKFEEDLIHQYDTNYYFPKSGGKDINMIFLDSGFNFRSGDFANTHQRTVKCAFNVTNGKIAPVYDEKYCHASIPNDHGSRVSDCAAGYEHGIANKANIIGVVLNELNSANIIAAYQYVLDNLLVPHKTVINCSFGEPFPKDMYNEAMIHSEDLINKINDNGGVMVVSSGNNGYNVNDDVNNNIYYPCAFKNTLCVGGIDNYDLESVNFDLANYRRTNVISSSSIYKRFQYSNYGKEVSVYAPFFVRVAFLDSENNYIDGIDGGTSYSSPIVAGIAATIMSENPDIKFNTSIMTKYITRLSEKNIIKNIDKGFPNAFINNGKHVVYSDDNLYNGCGIRAGNQKCPHNKCCSADNKCTNDQNLCRSDKGCQVISSLDTCKNIPSPVEGRCGNGFGSCPFGYCCSSEGVCGKSTSFCGAGCQINYGSCY
ncbi:subtilisin-like protein [Neocallimastix lanati (nom. inval.)]|uniref:Subtilisin-like protein n=1 Tax=Neocallimastix californiae TaxID=1754190 RepID=A0A1Y2F0U2_9FUNG|nr:subtilisin-like protein [Neocallimastix sp. JGI-2020a]ORY77460.1 subtilisin-like protein [Neocallimastix californiae]|eukprot:ORY77460.1 subtilisin-like protein [Neocallimastix californiae]